MRSGTHAAKPVLGRVPGWAGGTRARPGVPLGINAAPATEEANAPAQCPGADGVLPRCHGSPGGSRRPLQGTGAAGRYGPHGVQFCPLYSKPLVAARVPATRQYAPSRHMVLTLEPFRGCAPDRGHERHERSDHSSDSSYHGAKPGRPSCDYGRAAAPCSRNLAVSSSRSSERPRSRQACHARLGRSGGTGCPRTGEHDATAEPRSLPSVLRLPDHAKTTPTIGRGSAADARSARMGQTVHEAMRAAGVPQGRWRCCCQRRLVLQAVSADRPQRAFVLLGLLGRPHAVTASTTWPPQSARATSHGTRSTSPRSCPSAVQRHACALLSPFPTLLLGVRALRPGHRVSSSGLPLSVRHHASRNLHRHQRSTGPLSSGAEAVPVDPRTS
jgi:hypothetical protein